MTRTTNQKKTHRGSTWQTRKQEAGHMTKNFKIKDMITKKKKNLKTTW